MKNSYIKLLLCAVIMCGANNVFNAIRAHAHTGSFMVTTSDGINIAGLKIERPQTGRVILLCHGLGDSKDNLAPHFAQLFPHDTIYAIDFRGHGKSSGKTTIGIDEYRDVIAIVQHIRGENKDAKVVGIGISMGGVSLLKAAAHGAPIDAIVTEGSYATPKSLQGVYFDGDTAPTSDVRNYGQKVTVPVLIMHSYTDTVAPHADADIIQRSVKNGKVVKVNKVPHACISSCRPDIYQKVAQDFFREHKV